MRYSNEMNLILGFLTGVFLFIGSLFSGLFWPQAPLPVTTVTPPHSTVTSASSSSEVSNEVSPSQSFQSASLPTTELEYLATTSQRTPLPWVSLRNEIEVNGGGFRLYELDRSHSQEQLLYCYFNNCHPVAMTDLDNVFYTDGVGFSKDQTGIFIDGSSSREPLAGADASTFAVYQKDYGADSKHVYDEYGNVVPGIDGGSYMEMALYNDGGPPDPSYDYGFAKDKNAVYFGVTPPANPISGADPQSFLIGSTSFYGFDKNHTYCIGSYSPRPQNAPDDLYIPVRRVLVVQGYRPSACQRPGLITN